ncbi:MAG: hypothetical protein H6Q36_1328 [Chloroflexi bacterium]|nr:hypothetical protein [Chloroflexota bacterium]
MSLPTSCTSCHQPFSRVDHHRRLSLLDGPIALCGDCAYLVDHPESVLTRRPAAWAASVTDRRAA